MKIVVLGGRGLIGAKTVETLRGQGHEVIAASTKTGVNSVTGEGLADALKGADVVVDVTNSPDWEDNAVMNFFDKSTRNLLAVCSEAGVKHVVALSVVGTEGLQGSGYFRAKQRQEELIKKGKVPYTIVRATQFFEFLCGIAEFGEKDGEVHLSTAQLQPIAAADVAALVADVALSKPSNGTVEIAGPDRGRLCDIVSQYMEAKHDTRKIVSGADAKYYGIVLKEASLVPSSSNARLGPTKLKDWLCAPCEK
ncbi:MAG TPA: SDR family oxidoreductase [Trichormus sp.]|jgi:uncharacterized protein YbjT (DUF2867 family)